MTKDKLAEELDIYMKRIINALDYFKLYQNMLIMSNENLDNANKIASFIDIVVCSLSIAAINETYLLVDKRNDKNIFKFIEVCKQNQQLFRHELTEDYVDCDTNEHTSYVAEKVNIKNEFKKIDQKLLKYSNQIENLKSIRDKVLAHVDKKYFYDRNLISKDYSVKYQDIDDILELLYAIVNRLSVLLTGTIYGYSNEQIIDFKAILDCIQ